MFFELNSIPCNVGLKSLEATIQIVMSSCARIKLEDQICECDDCGKRPRDDNRRTYMSDGSKA